MGTTGADVRSIRLRASTTSEIVEMKDVEIPPNMQRVMAMEAEAIREKRARIIKAEGEMAAAEKPDNALGIKER